jgi:hypothetical protein
MQNHPGPIASLRKRLFLDAEVENHPLFASLLSSAFDREAEQRIALEIFYVVNAFPRFLSAKTGGCGWISSRACSTSTVP